MRATIVPEKLRAYMAARGTPELSVMPELRARTAALGEQSRMQIDVHQGQVMAFLLQLIGAQRVLEIGTFTGMSALWMASALSDDTALPDGVALPDGLALHCCDISGEWTDIARAFWAKAGLADKIHLHLAPALETLPKFMDDSFDAVFIDADKGNYQNYINAAARVLRMGGLLMIDNTLWGGDVVDEGTSDKITRTIQAVNDALAVDSRFHAVMLPIGDGLTVAMKC